MKPPVCAICGKTLTNDEGGLVYFKRRESDREWDRRAAESGMIGHPPYADWFCGDHFNDARERSVMTRERAMAELGDKA